MRPALLAVTAVLLAAPLAAAEALEGKVLVRAPRPEDVAHKQGEGAGEAAAAPVSVEASGVEIRSAR